MKVIRAIKYLFLIAVAVALVVLAMANRDPVTLTLCRRNWHCGRASTSTIELPLFVVILGGVATGVLVGLRLGMAARASPPGCRKTNHREAKKLEREVEALRGKKNEGRDEVLALVEDAEAAR
jgi:putative membrane protein